MTDAEKRLWRALREAFPGVRVRRQHPVGLFVVDFAIPSLKLAIEIDGGQHVEAQDVDIRRSEAIAELGYRVIRFWNNEVAENVDGVLRQVQLEMERAPTSPRPSPPRRRGG